MADDRRERWLATLDPGIASFVDVLDAAGIETFESYEGTEGHGFLGDPWNSRGSVRWV
jgi:hypothetical protein